ncbi:MAG: DEAD/DEAH box helicase [Candidatus Hodarchaeota archaeon]
MVEEQIQKKNSNKKKKNSSTSRNKNNVKQKRTHAPKTAVQAFKSPHPRERKRSPPKKANIPDRKVLGEELSFSNLGLIKSLYKAVRDAGYKVPTPIQAQAIPLLLKGRDILGCAQTGTGKTAAFALPILQYLVKNHREGKTRPIRSLVLAPTRELAIQIAESFSNYGKYTRIKNTVIYGGVGQNPQVEALKRGVDILVATPGRLLDLIGQGYIKLNSVEILVFDEADRMLDMGFIHDMRRILKYVPNERQTLLFSATIPEDIVKLGRKLLKNPARITISPDKPAVEIIEQLILPVPKEHKQKLLEFILECKNLTRVLVFSRTKHGANRIVKKLVKKGINAEPIHGNKSQTARQQALKNFREGKTRVLVATDVAARGIDVDDISHVVQYDLPNVPETYVHRIGRTGRAGATGRAISFCMESEKKQLKDIEDLIGFSIEVEKNHPYLHVDENS